MNKAITRLSTWHSTGEDENYCVTDIYVDDLGRTIICVSSLDSGFYEEWHIGGFYRGFTFVSEESL